MNTLELTLLVIMTFCVGVMAGLVFHDWYTKKYVLKTTDDKKADDPAKIPVYEYKLLFRNGYVYRFYATRVDIEKHDGKITDISITNETQKNVGFVMIDYDEVVFITRSKA